MRRLVEWVALSRSPDDAGPVLTSRPLPFGGVWDPAEPTSDALCALGTVVRALHDQPAPGPARSLREALIARCEAALTAARAASLDPGAEGDALLAWVEARAEEPPSVAAVHGDLGARAIRRGPGGEVGLADWQHARVDDPWADLAAVAWMPEAARDAFASGYGPLPARGPRLDAQVAGVAFDRLARALAAPPPARAAALAVFRAVSRSLQTGVPARPPALAAVRAEHLLARLIATPVLDAAALARWCVAALGVDGSLAPPEFEVFAAAPIGLRASVPPVAGDWIDAVLARPLLPGADLRLPFAAAVVRVGAAVGGLPDDTARIAGALLPRLCLPGPQDAASTALYGTLAWSALAVLERHTPARRDALVLARRVIEQALAEAADALGVVGWRHAGWSADPSPLRRIEGAPLGFLGPLVAEAFEGGAVAVPVAALLRTLGVPEAVAQRAAD